MSESLDLLSLLRFPLRYLVLSDSRKTLVARQNTSGGQKGLGESMASRKFFFFIDNNFRNRFFCFLTFFLLFHFWKKERVDWSKNRWRRILFRILDFWVVILAIPDGIADYKFMCPTLMHFFFRKSEQSWKEILKIWKGFFSWDKSWRKLRLRFLQMNKKLQDNNYISFSFFLCPARNIRAGVYNCFNIYIFYYIFKKKRFTDVVHIRNKYVTQDVVFRVFVLFCSPRSFGIVATPREILRQTRLLYISDAYFNLLMFFVDDFLSCVSIGRTDYLDFWRTRHACPRRKSG
jgi:hypothetical protein